MYWIDVETNPSAGCGWQDANTNCGFLQNLVSAFQATGVKVGIFASINMWNSIFGSPNACNQFSSLELWYTNYDGQQNFNDFKAFFFGGWTSAKIKHYNGSASPCGVSADLNWHPVSSSNTFIIFYFLTFFIITFILTLKTFFSFFYIKSIVYRFNFSLFVNFFIKISLSSLKTISFLKIFLDINEFENQRKYM